MYFQDASWKCRGGVGAGADTEQSPEALISQGQKQQRDPASGKMDRHRPGPKVLSDLHISVYLLLPQIMSWLPSKDTNQKQKQLTKTATKTTTKQSLLYIKNVKKFLLILTFLLSDSAVLNILCNQCPRLKMQKASSLEFI